MQLRRGVVWWVSALPAILMGLWLLNLALANWWAGSGPPTQAAKQYVERGNWLGIGACSFMSLAVAFIAVGIARCCRKADK